MGLDADIQSFKERLMEQFEKLNQTAGFQESLMDYKHREAFLKLIDEAWFAEEKAMENSRIPDIMNNLILVANIHNKMEIEALQKKIEELEKQLEEIEGIN